MPVTAKLSKLFYDRLGEAVTNELVDWFNQVDAAYKSDMREMNELNFVRFDAKQEQRLAVLDAKFDQRLAALDAKFEQRLTTIDGKIDLTAARLTAALEKGLREQTRFFFLAWGVLLASNIALWFR